VPAGRAGDSLKERSDSMDGNTLSIFTSYAPYIWVVAVIIFAVVEGMTAQLVSIWFVVGSIGALVASLLGANWWVQGIVFLALTLLTLLGTRPLVKRLSRVNHVETNADRVIGKTAVVTEEIDNLAGKGQVKVLGNVWSARSVNDDMKIPVGQHVVVQKIEGVKLIVSFDSKNDTAAP